MSQKSPELSILRLIAGLIFVLAGLLAYLRVGVGLSFIALVFVVAGITVVTVGLLGRNARGSDIAVLIIGLIVLAGAASSYSYQTTIIHSISATTNEVPVSEISIDSSTEFGSITIKFSGNADLAYQITFSETAFASPFFFLPRFGNFSLSNRTEDGVLILNANSTESDITVTLGSRYLIDVDASGGTGTIDLYSSSQNQKFGRVSLSAGTGSIHAEIDTSSISYLYLQTGTGAVSLTSKYLSTSNPQVPITLSTGTGALNFDVGFPSTIGVNLSATNGFGSISKSLPGFEILQSSNGELDATEGDMSGPSFEVSLSVGTGSMNVNGSLVNPQR